jgi:hypothetical protein
MPARVSLSDERYLNHENIWDELTPAIKNSVVFFSSFVVYRDLILASRNECSDKPGILLKLESTAENFNALLKASEIPYRFKQSCIYLNAGNLHPRQPQKLPDNTFFSGPY